MGRSCALTQLKSDMQRTWLRSNSEAGHKPEGQSPDSRKGWQNSDPNTKINSESCIYWRGTSANTVRALSPSQQPLHLFGQTGSRSLLKAEVLLRTNTRCSNSPLSPPEWCLRISSTLAADNMDFYPRISACPQTSTRHCHRADGIWEGEGASTTCQKNTPFNVLSGLMKHLKYCPESNSLVTLGHKNSSAFTPAFEVTRAQQYRCSLWKWVLSTGESLPMLRSLVRPAIKKKKRLYMKEVNSKCLWNSITTLHAQGS